MKYSNLQSRLTRTVLTALIVSCSILSAKSQATVKHPAQEKTTTAPDQPGTGAGAIVDNFFKKYKKDGTGPAVDYLFGTNKLFTDTVQIGVLKTKLDALRQTIGKYLGKELIAQRTASPSLVFYSYLVKHEKSPMRFEFMFYKPGSTWVLYRFKFDDQMDGELEEAGKINNKKVQ